MEIEKFKENYLEVKSLGIALDTSLVGWSDGYVEQQASVQNGIVQKALEAMDALEAGGIANPDENRMVGHYWLRDSSLAPSKEIQNVIDTTLKHIKEFASKVHSRAIVGENGKPFKNLLCIGIGGSALGPQFIQQAFSQGADDKLAVFFLDNTDPDGMDIVFKKLKGGLGQTLVITTSKSGGTPETRNGYLETKAVFEKAGLAFEKHAVAITQEGSKLHQTAQNWLVRFPMWDWVGGRTSTFSAVGLLPAVLAGFDVDSFLEGARLMDIATRTKEAKQNPALRLALAWFYLTEGVGAKDMVVLPYKDRLELFSRYLQQLVMESLGKEKDLNGKVVHQGIAVYGNKGSTDQHAYVQQLREGVPNFFVTFIEVLKDRQTQDIPLEDTFTSGDFLNGFLLGTRLALFENQRASITLTLPEISPQNIGALIALYERAVGFYATFVNINAYHQPGVEAGKKAASDILAYKQALLKVLKNNPEKSYTLDALMTTTNQTIPSTIAFKLLQHACANGKVQLETNTCSSGTSFQYKAPKH